MINIQDLLKNYRENRAKVNFIILENEGWETLLKQDLQPIDTDEKEVIEEQCLSASVITDTPRSITNKFNSKTENAALNYREYLNRKPLTKPEIRDVIKKNKEKITVLEMDVKLVDTVFLPCLDVKEEFIIRSLYFEGYSWHEITARFAEKFDAREEPTLKDMRKYALQKMGDIINSKTA